MGRERGERPDALQRRLTLDPFWRANCGVNESTAYGDVQNAIGLLDDIRRDKAEHYRALELLRLDAMTLSLITKVVALRVRVID